MQIFALRQLIRQRVLQEINVYAIDQVLGAIRGEDLKFGHLFGSKKRIVVSFESIALKRIKDMFEEADPSTQIDIDGGTVTKTIQTRQGPRQRTERLGRVIQKNLKSAKKKFVTELNRAKIEEIKGQLQSIGKNDLSIRATKVAEAMARVTTRPDLVLPTLAEYISYTDSRSQPVKGIHITYRAHDTVKQWLSLIKSRPKALQTNYESLVSTANVYLNLFVAQKTYAEEAGGSVIVISRAPIDVLRMSDFKNIQSCHSEGGQYFHCAIQEAQDGGFIAYLVSKKDLATLYSSDLDVPEIFEDKKRNVPGIKPIARARLRQFRHKDGWDLAVPEVAIYGNDREGFLESVTKWAHDSQFVHPRSKVDYDPNKIDMKDFVWMGATYRSDSSSDELFNNLFNTERFRGDVEYGGEFKDQSVQEQVQEEAQGYYDNYSFSYVGMDWNADEEGVSWDWGWDGSYNYQPEIEAKLDTDKIDDAGIERDIDHYINRYFPDVYVLVSVDIFDDWIEVSVSIDESDSGHPDEFDNALRIATETDNKIDDLENDIDEFLDGIDWEELSVEEEVV